MAREKIRGFAQELFILDGSTDFMFDLKVWLDDYMEFLEQEEEQEQLEKVCRKLLKLFAWERHRRLIYGSVWHHLCCL